MIGWRARLGFLLPPGNPTVEPEMIALAPEGVSVHFHRMAAHGPPGSLEGQDERTRTMIDNIDGSIELLASVEPHVIVVAHTATSYHLGRQGEADLIARLQKSTGTRVTRPISIRSNRFLPSSRPCCAKPTHARSRPPGGASAVSSTASPPRNAPTTSPMPAMLQLNRITL